MDIHPASRWHNSEFTRETHGFFPRSDPPDSCARVVCDLDPWDNVRRDMMTLLLRTIEEAAVPGDFAELGVYRGSTARLIHHYAPDRMLHLFDTFEGFTAKGAASELQKTAVRVAPSAFSDTSLEAVRAYISPRNANVVFHRGYFPEAVPPALASHRFAFVHLDADLYEPIIEALRFFYPRMADQGIILVHDYNAWPGARKAVDEFLSHRREVPIAMPDKSGSALIVTQQGE